MIHNARDEWRTWISESRGQKKSAVWIRREDSQVIPSSLEVTTRFSCSLFNETGICVVVDSQCHSFWSKVDEDWFDFLSKRHQNREWGRSLMWRWEKRKTRMAVKWWWRKTGNQNSTVEEAAGRRGGGSWLSSEKVKHKYCMLILSCVLLPLHFLIPWRCFVLDSFCYYPSSWFPIKVSR